MADEIAELVECHWAVAAELEKCANYALTIAAHLRSDISDMPEAEQRALLGRFHRHGTRAFEHLQRA